MFVSKPLAKCLMVNIPFWIDFFCTDPCDSGLLQTGKGVLNIQGKFYGQMWVQMVKKGLKMANNLAPLKICK
jgi:hypothetical protein